MSNFRIFDHDHLKLLLEPFAPGMAEHITPIKYEALTPDAFLFLFRTTGKDSMHHFFVSLETDYLSGLDGARCTIEDWHNSFVRFWPLHSLEGEVEEKMESFKVPTKGPYFAMLAEVEQPTGKNYWAEAITILPGDTIKDKITHLSAKEQEGVYKTLHQILQHKTDSTDSFLDSLTSKRTDVIVNDVNKTNMAVSLYVQPNGTIECFYNYVAQDTDSRRPGKKETV